MSRLLAIFCVMLLGFTNLMAADAPTSGQADSDAVRLFRLRLTSTDDWFRFVASDTSIDAESRAQLHKLLEERSRIIDAEIEKIRAGPIPLSELNVRISQLNSELAKSPEEAQLFKDNLLARQRLERRTNAAMSIAMAHFENRKELAAATVKAGLPAARENEALRIVDDAHQRFVDAATVYLPKEQQIKALPPGEARELAIQVLQAEAQHIWFGVARSVYFQLRGLLQPDQYDAFDQAVLKVSW